MILPGPLDLDRDGEFTSRDLFLLNEMLEDSEESDELEDDILSDSDSLDFGFGEDDLFDLD